MTDRVAAFARALFDRLAAQVTLAPVHQHVPEDTPPPVVIIGDVSMDNAGPKGGGLDQVEFDMVTVVRGPGRKPLHALQAEVRAAIEGWQPLTETGQASVPVFLSATAIMAEDGISYIGSQRFSIWLQD